MALKQLVPPAQNPVSLEETLNFLKVEPGVDDQLILQLVETATLAVEAFTGRALLRQKWEMRLNPAFGSAWSDQEFLDFRSLVENGGIIIPKAPFLTLDVAPVICHQEKGIRPVMSFRVDISQDQARLHVDAGRVDKGKDALVISYWVGYGEKEEDIPSPIRTSILDLVDILYQERSVGQLPLTPVMTPKILALLSPYRLSISLN
ncbi:hypothetical protein OAN22_00330 [Alphaproteobacteria bacterium]|nr:hypothetical protein [Alphaproteobacteria bacterium]